jgi:hypothetical protein
MNKSFNSHYLVGYYATHQPDGVHIEAHCTCGEKLEGVGPNESAATSALWKAFREHTRDKNTIGAGLNLPYPFMMLPPVLTFTPAPRNSTSARVTENATVCCP